MLLKKHPLQFVQSRLRGGMLSVMVLVSFRVVLKLCAWIGLGRGKPDLMMGPPNGFGQLLSCLK